MTLEEFKKGYAKRSGITVEKLHEIGYYGILCDCDFELCEGWQMERERITLLIEKWRQKGQMLVSPEAIQALKGGKDV